MAYYAWHSASVAFVFVAAGYVAAAILPERWDYAAVSSLFAACLVATAAFVCVKARISPLNFPAIFMFSLIAGLGLAGLAA